MEIKITNDNFNSEVESADIPVILDFWAEWCGPCRMIAPIVKEIAEENEGKIKIGKVNVDDETALAMKFGITSIPTLILFRNGKPSASLVGLRTKEDIIKSFGL